MSGSNPGCSLTSDPSPPCRFWSSSVCGDLLSAELMCSRPVGRQREATTRRRTPKVRPASLVRGNLLKSRCGGFCRRTTSLVDPRLQLLSSILVQPWCCCHPPSARRILGHGGSSFFRVCGFRVNLQVDLPPFITQPGFFIRTNKNQTSFSVLTFALLPSGS